MATKTFGETLAEERKARNITRQVELAALLREHGDGKYPSDQLVNFWESNDRRPSPRGFQLIADFFGWDLVKRDALFRDLFSTVTEAA